MRASVTGPRVSIFYFSYFLLFVPRRDIVPLDMTIEEAAKLIISAGLVSPPEAKAPPVKAPPPVRAARTAAPTVAKLAP